MPSFQANMDPFSTILIVLFIPGIAAVAKSDSGHEQEHLDMKTDISVLQDLVSKLNHSLQNVKTELYDKEKLIFEMNATIQAQQVAATLANATIQHLKQKLAIVNTRIEAQQRKTTIMNSTIQAQQREAKIMNATIQHQKQILAIMNTSIESQRSDSRKNDSKNIAFTASSSSTLRNFDVSRIIYDKVISNIGNAYNSKTGIFTCPSPGTYVFYWSSMSASGSEPCYTRIYHNGVGLMMTVSEERGGGADEVASNMITLSLVLGDRVWVQTARGAFCSGYPYTSFSGWKL